MKFFKLGSRNIVLKILLVESLLFIGAGAGARVGAGEKRTFWPAPQHCSYRNSIVRYFFPLNKTCFDKSELYEYLQVRKCYEKIRSKLQLVSLKKWELKISWHFPFKLHKGNFCSSPAYDAEWRHTGEDRYRISPPNINIIASKEAGGRGGGGGGGGRGVQDFYLVWPCVVSVGVFYGEERYCWPPCSPGQDRETALPRHVASQTTYSITRALTWI